MMNVTSIVPNDARSGGPSLASSSRPSSIEKYQESPMLISPPVEDLEHVDTAPHCTGCKSASPAVANCFSCSSLLCANCVIAHQLMVAFEGHHVTNLGQGKIETRDPTVIQGQTGSIDAVRRMVKEAKKKLNELRKTIKSVDYSSSRLSSQYDKAMGEVDETYNFYMSMLAERKFDVTKEIEKLYSTKQVALSVFGQKIHESTDKIEQMVTFTEKLLQSPSTKDVLLFQSSLESRMQHLVSTLPQLDLANTVQLEFISNFQAIQVGVRNQFGYIKSGSEKGVALAKQPPISRPSMALAVSQVPAPSHSQVNSVMSGLSATKSDSTFVPGTSSYSPFSNLGHDFQNNSLLFGHGDVNPYQGLQASPLDILENLSMLASGSVTSNPDVLSTITNSSPMPMGPTASLATPVPSAPIVYPPKASENDLSLQVWGVRDLGGSVHGAQWGGSYRGQRDHCRRHQQSQNPSIRQGGQLQVPVRGSRQEGRAATLSQQSRCGVILREYRCNGKIPTSSGSNLYQVRSLHQEVRGGYPSTP